MSDKIIRSISLKNFKCHQDTSLELKPLTILSGGNAAGKSTVIQSLLMLEGCFKSLSKGTISTDNIYGVNLGLPSSIISLNHDTESIIINANINNIDTKVELELHGAEEESLSFIIANVEDMATNKVFDDLSLFYLNAERNGPRITSSISESLGLYVGSRGENTNYAITKMDLLERTNPQLKIHNTVKSAEINRFSANCEAWLSMIIPDTKISTSANHELNVSTLKISNKGEYYYPTATGFGISYVLPIIVQALIASTNEMKPAVLIVENPEAHLHPYSQSMIAKFLALIATCGVQVILETHSEHIINGCRLQLARSEATNLMKILFFSDDAECEEISITSHGELEFWPKGFFDQTKTDLRELLELRRCGK